MKFLDLTFPAPAENLACDEALLDACEDGTGAETLRCWEAPAYFVVVGYANAVATEVHRAACQARNIPILRRCTGGGTVVQGPGCLNYSLILKVTDDGPCRSITSANKFIMERHATALNALFPPSSIFHLTSAIEVHGHTDLALNGVKFSGNAQRRKQRSLLFHGSFLLNFDLPLISELLPLPSRQPDYRQNRPHEKFLTNLGMDAGTIRRALRAAWNAREPLEKIPRAAVALLARDKYVTNEWNFKF